MRLACSESSPYNAHLLLRSVVLVFALNLLSSILFIAVVRSPVYDDSVNMSDVRAYAGHGISIKTIREQSDAPGPTGFIWMSLAVRLLRGDALFDARIAALLSWILLTGCLILVARRSERPDLWYFGLLAALTFPHTLTASATVLTEGPALLFAYFGCAAWIHGFWKSNLSGRTSVAWAVLGGLSMGMAVTCRQYFGALLPSAGLLAVILLWEYPSHRKLSAWVGLVTSLSLAALPPFLLILIWRGITSPRMAAGTSYSNLRAGLGLTLFRPLDVTFYVALYLLPFSFPAVWYVSRRARWVALIASLVGGFVVASFEELLVNPGPLKSLLNATSRFPAAKPLLFWVIASAVIYNAIGVGLAVWSKRWDLRTCAPVLFSMLMIFFFIVEQFGVGGNVPFYDRYVLQLAPFLGIVGFWVSPKLTRVRILALAALLVLSNGMLWRYIFMR